MWYRVSGVNRSTGQEGTLNVQANSRNEAEQIAQRSMIVSEVELEPGYNPPPPAPPKIVIPEYKAITHGASLLNLIGWLNYAAAILCVGGAVIALILGYQADYHEGRLTAISLILSAMWLAISGAVLNMLAALGEAIRDMARNSFHR